MKSHLFKDMVEMKKQQTQSEIVGDIELLYIRIKKLEIEEMVTYDELNSLISKTPDGIARKVQKEDRHLLDRARRKILNEDKVVIGLVAGVGVKRLDDVGIIAETYKDRKYILRPWRANQKNKVSSSIE